METVEKPPLEFSQQPTLPLGRCSTGAEHLVLIVPSDEEEREANAMENWFQACASDEPFSLELVGTRREQGLVLRASSAEQLVLLTKQFAAHYPQAEVQRIAPEADPLVLQPGEHAVIGSLAMTKKPWMPLKTFTGKMLAEPGADPLAGLLAAMEPVGAGQRLICQLALQRAPEQWIARAIRKAVEHPLQSERDAANKSVPPTSDTQEGLKTLLLVVGLLGALVGSHWYHTHAWLPLALLLLGLLGGSIGVLWWWVTHSRQEIYDMKLVAEKLSRVAFYTHLRLIVIGQQTTSTEAQLRAHLKRMEVAYRQFTLASANGLALKHPWRLTPEHKLAAKLPLVAWAFPYRHRLHRLLHRGAPCTDIWNGLELAGAFHPPQSFTDVPLVHRLSVKHLLASPEIARQIEQAPGPLPPALIGTSTHRGYSVPVYVPFQTLFSHTFLAARSRYGKSTLIQLLAQAAMQPVRDGSLQPGCFVIDPHKDLIEGLLLLVPPSRRQEVILLDLTDTQQVVALNPLDASMGFTRDQAVAQLMSSFERIWGDFWGPRMSYFLKQVLLLCFTLNEDLVRSGQAHKQYTLLDVNPLLQYPEYATQALAQLDRSRPDHQERFAWWQHVYFALPKQLRSEAIMPIVSKLGVFQDTLLLRRIVGQPVTKTPVHLCITQGKIVLCALSARDMEDAAVNVLGSTLINLLHRAFGIQQQVPLMERRKVFCAADEFHAFSGGDFDRLLSEDTKLGCSFLLATQNFTRLHKIREGLLQMVFSNCDNLFAFNVSAADAKLLEEELRGVVEQKHIMSQPRLHCYARLALPQAPLQVISTALATPASWQHSGQRQQQAEAMRAQAATFTTSAQDIDQHYAEHLAQYLDDVAPAAQEYQHEAQAKQYQQDRRRQANELQQQVDAQRAPGPRPRETDRGDGRPASLSNSLADKAKGVPGGEAEAQARHRNNQRSKRKKSQANPIADSSPQSPGEENAVQRLRTSLGKGASGWGSERERRE